MPTALALAPHLDDAAFSCGGLLASLAQRGWRVVMATLFTGSVADPRGFALACQLDKGLAPEIDYMSLRRDEDVRAAAALAPALAGLIAAESPDLILAPQAIGGHVDHVQAVRALRSLAVPTPV